MFERVISIALASILLLSSGHLLAAYESQGQKTIVMGGSALALRNTTKQDAEVAFNAVLDEAIKNPDMKVHVSVYASTEALYAAFDSGEIDGIFGTPLEYLGRANQLGDDVMVLSYKNTGIRQSMVLIGRKSDAGMQLKDLRNKRLTLSWFQDIEALYLNTLLLKNQLPEIPAFFASRLEAKNANVAIMDVFFDKSDVTIVRESEFLTAMELNPQIGRKLVILDKSVPMIPALGSVRKTLDSEKNRNLMKDIEKVSDTSKGSRILSMSQASSIAIISPDEMKGVFDMVREYESLKKTKSQGNASVLLNAPKAKDKRNARPH